MRKVRRKWLSILLTLAMLVGLVVPLAAPAAAAVDYADVVGTYKYVDNDAEDQPAGSVTIKATSDFTRPEDSASQYVYNNTDTVYATLTLPAGVTFSLVDEVYVNGTEVGSAEEVLYASDDEITLELSKEQFIVGVTISNIILDVDADVTGSINVDVTVWGTNTEDSETTFDYSESVTIAKVRSGAVSVTVDDPELITVGSSRAGAKVTIKELSPGALDEGKAIKLTIKKSGVKWDNSKMDSNAVKVTGVLADSPVVDDKGKNLIISISKASTTVAGRIEITPYFKVDPTATEGDVVVELSGNVLDTQSLVLATIGEGEVVIDVEDNDGTIYQGLSASLDTEITLDVKGSFEFGEDDYITMTLPEGFKWVKDEPMTVEDKDGSPDVDVDYYNSDRTAWFMFPRGGASGDVTISGLKIIAKGNAPVGDVYVTFGGDVEGKVKIAECKAPITVSAEKATLVPGVADQEAGDIYIKEVADGALDPQEYNDGNAIAITLKAPLGIDFSAAKVEVDDGDITVPENVYREDNTLTFYVTRESSVASTIKISDIKYDVSATAATGDVEVKVYVNDLDNYVTKVANATVVSPSARTAVFTLGSNVYTVNGVEYTMDVAAYVKNGRTYLPVRYVAYALGVDPNNVLWNEATKTVTLLKGMNAVQFTIGSKELKLNGISVSMDAAPEVQSGRTMLPFRFIAQAFGASVSYDEATKTVTMNLE
ncbi:copper amine oxidase N-terminal domain-containing protein [Thermanaeromonas sp. C210]|uniref:copper amine oxidase N-terminal domain-containing protein n=1 Tax=Thermanaeromonas sp. C210 TaxID=2731925 RepID=UPI00155C8AF5|nr:copper amine oxidase N-terminal domain-containing protein [Thermanaeromonas sp. C210]GFN21784.1 copper amine oxidase-like protein [Thermanaeromonas sp. C210]